VREEVNGKGKRMVDDAEGGGVTTRLVVIV
jgi:hypothetical protein